MVEDLIVHPRVMERHPEIAEPDVRVAWANAIAAVSRIDDEADRLVVLGIDPHGRLVEMVANRIPDGRWVVFHAMTPPSSKTLAELRMTRR